MSKKQTYKEEQEEVFKNHTNAIIALDRKYLRRRILFLTLLLSFGCCFGTCVAWLTEDGTLIPALAMQLGITMCGLILAFNINPILVGNSGRIM